jgi:hypothetical protein
VTKSAVPFKSEASRAAAGATGPRLGLTPSSLAGHTRQTTQAAAGPEDPHPTAP